MISQNSIDFIEEKFLGRVVAEGNPSVHATCGIPGAGKSTFVDMQIKSGRFSSNAYILNPDRVMIALPEYHHDKDVIGPQAAYRKWELPARELAYDMADFALANRLNVIKDMGCANPLSKDFILKAKEIGYVVTMYHIDCSIDEAFRRIDQRDFQIAREEVIKRQQMLESLLPDYKIIANRFIAFDNSDLNTPFRQIAA